MKKLVSVLLAASMTLSLVACGSSATDSSASADSTEATTVAATATNTDTNVLYINLASEPDYLDPALNSSVDGGTLIVNSFAGLYTYDENGDIVPDLATDMPTVSEDGLTYQITMIESQWSNGEELTANDFVYSWNRVIADETAADYAYLFDAIARNDDGTLAVTADDDYTLTITLVSPCPYFTSLLAFPTFYPVYQADVEAANPDGTTPGAWAQEAGFVCNGAYVLTSWSHNESMVYTKNEYYHDAENVTMDELDFMLSADDTATYAAYNSGDLDFIDSVPTDEIASVIDSDEFYIADQLGTYYVAFNVDSDLFDGLTVEQAADFRHAISLLIDRQWIVDTVGQTGQEVADSFVPAGMSDGNGGIFKTDDISYYDATTTDVETAIELLEGCGYEFTDNGDGTYSVSPAISIPYILNENTGHQAVAESIQADLAVVGIEMTIETQDWNVFLENRKNGNYTFAREGWVADYDDPINFLELFTTASGNNDPQFGKSDSSAAPDWTEFDSLIAEIYTTTDFAERAELLHEAEDILMNTWAVIPIYYYNDIYMMKSNVDNVYCTVFGMKYFMYATKA